MLIFCRKIIAESKLRKASSRWHRAFLHDENLTRSLPQLTLDIPCHSAKKDETVNVNKCITVAGRLTSFNPLTYCYLPTEKVKSQYLGPLKHMFIEE